MIKEFSGGSKQFQSKFLIAAFFAPGAGLS
jgi:hypothetical protein